MLTHLWFPCSDFVIIVTILMSWCSISCRLIFCPTLIILKKNPHFYLLGSQLYCWMVLLGLRWFHLSIFRDLAVFYALILLLFHLWKLCFLFSTTGLFIHCRNIPCFQVGMATNIPPHNIGELVDVLCVLIRNPEATVYV